MSSGSQKAAPAVAPKSEPSPLQSLACALFGSFFLRHDRETAEEFFEAGGFSKAIEDANDPRTILVLAHALQDQGVLPASLELPPVGTAPEDS